MNGILENNVVEILNEIQMNLNVDTEVNYISDVCDCTGWCYGDCEGDCRGYCD